MFDKNGLAIIAQLGELEAANAKLRAKLKLATDALTWYSTSEPVELYTNASIIEHQRMAQEALAAIKEEV